MSKKQNFNFYIFLIILPFLFLSCEKDFKTLKYYYVQENKNFTAEQIKRLSNYLNGEFYSYDVGRNIFAYPIAFLISESGNKSVILACDGIIDECNTSVEIYQLIKKYEKKNNENFYILALKNKILINDYNFKNQLSKTKLTLKKNKNIFYDHIYLPSDNCSGDDC